LENVMAAVIEEWFGGRGEAPVSRRSNLGRLSAIFSFAVRQSARSILWARQDCPRFLA
jgi:hypothetical protein